MHIARDGNAVLFEQKNKIPAPASKAAHLVATNWLNTTPPPPRAPLFSDDYDLPRTEWTHQLECVLLDNDVSFNKSSSFRAPKL